MKRLISLMIFAMFSLNCGFAQQCSLFDITGLAHGTVVNNLFQANGVTIQAIPNPGGTNKAVIYNTNGNWTEDPDLNVGIGNIIIINENPNNNDGDGTGPDDNATGGTLRFLFASPVTVVSFIAVDVDKPGAVAIAYDAANNVITSVNIPKGADASVQTITMNAPGTRKLEIIYRDSGGFRLNLSCPNICDAFDISGLAHGTHVDSMFMSSGITVVAIPNPGGRPDAVIYNTNGNWTEDPDLNVGIGNIIIINENPNNNDGDGTGPDDNATGGTLRFLFASPVTVVSFIAVDVDKPGAVAIAYDAANNVITSVNIPKGADASVQTIPVNAPGTRRFDLIYRDSGGFRLNLDCSTSQKRENSSDLTLAAANAPLQVRALPNPFSSQTNLQFSVNETVHARAELLSADGKIVHTLFDGIAAGGRQYDFKVYASDLTAGMYIFRVVTEKGNVQHTRLMLVK